MLSEDWSGDVCVVVGGGPSAAQVDPGRLTGLRVVGINEAGLTVVPFCDVLFWSDKRWLGWNRDRLCLHTGHHKVHRHSGVVPGAVRYRHKDAGLVMRDGWLGGVDSGSSAINLVVQLRCRVVYLVGFECRDLPMDRWQQGNFHRQHREPPLEGQREAHFLPAHRRMSADIARLSPSVRVYNTTPDSALDCWEKRDIEEVYQWAEKKSKRD